MATDLDTAADARRDVARLEAFSDGVFAIAITLLILDIKVPAVEAVAEHGGTLWAALVDQWPVYLAYVFSFVTILIMWVSHHAMFKYIGRTDQLFLVLNGLLLMGITAVPFPTALLSEYLQYGSGDDQNIAAAVYSGLFTVIAILFNLLWHYAARNNRLMGARLDPVFAQALARRYMLGPLAYFASLVLALGVGAWAGLAVYVLLAVFFALPTPTAALGRVGSGE